MNTTSITLRPEVDELWSKLTNDERAKVSTWYEIARRMMCAHDKGAELVMILKTYKGDIGMISKTSIYRKVAAIRSSNGDIAASGILHPSAIRRARGLSRKTVLPPGFVSWWRSLCGDHQRQKTLSVWRHLMRDCLMAGKIIPGYGKDWRGIWLAEHKGEMLPRDILGNPVCPYTDVHTGPEACAPSGWSYASLVTLAPEPDVSAGAAIGVHAMQAFNPVVPHTRVGLRPMQVITMDDVKLDVFCWYPGEKEPRRPVGLGVMDVFTGCMIDFKLIPATERADGTVSGLNGSWAKYVWANVFCGIGVDATEGVTALLEHGSAGLDPKEEQRINDILGPRPDGGRWLNVLRSSTSGAPILKGLFGERGRGRPTHKAMLESAWNLLHNEMAMLDAPAGRNWDTAPMDKDGAAGWSAEDKALINAAAQLVSRENPAAVEILKEATTHAKSYAQLSEAVASVIQTMNNRHDHSIQDWQECGFAKPMIEMGGALVTLDRAANDFAGDDEEMRQMFMRRMAGKARAVRMSPMEAWASYGGKTLKKFHPFVATQILGPDLAQEVVVDAHGQFTAVNHFSGKKMLYSAIIRQIDATLLHLAKGEKLHVWVNPIRVDWALVSRPTGEFLGLAKYMAATRFGSAMGDGNLGELALARSEQKRRLSSVLGGRITRIEERRANNARVLAAAAEAYAKPPTFKGEDALSLDEMTAASRMARDDAPDAGQEEDDETDGFSLARMNEFSRRV